MIEQGTFNVTPVTVAIVCNGISPDKKEFLSVHMDPLAAEI